MINFNDFVSTYSNFVYNGFIFINNGFVLSDNQWFSFFPRPELEVKTWYLRICDMPG